MVIIYFEPESIGLTKPYSRVGEYDGAASEMALMINEQCLDKEQNPFRLYVFAKTSNGSYYIDNVICERINVEQGGCLEPFSKGYPDETCKNRVTFDYPYGETGPEINQEFCKQVESEPLLLNDTDQSDYLYHEYFSICAIRGLIEYENYPYSDNLCIPGKHIENNEVRIRNGTHIYNNEDCRWEKVGTCKGYCGMENENNIQ